MTPSESLRGRLLEVLDRMRRGVETGEIDSLVIVAGTTDGGPGSRATSRLP